MNNILLIGGGGHCKSVIECINENNQFDKIGIIDRKENVGKFVMNIPIIGSDEDLTKLHEEGYTKAFITVGSVGNPKSRINLSERIEEIGFDIPNIISKTAHLSKFTKLYKGIFVSKGVIINADVVIKDFAILNTGCIIEHDVEIEKFVHIAPGAVICGGVKIGKNTHVGANSTIIQNISIGSDSVIGSGSNVVHNIASKSIEYGNPSREVKK